MKWYRYRDPWSYMLYEGTTIKEYIADIKEL